MEAEGRACLPGITSNTSCTLPMLTSGPVSGVGGGCCRGCECWCRWPRCRERLSVLPSVASLVLPPTAAQRTAVPLMSLTHKAAPLEEACTTDGNVVVPDRASMWPWWRSQGRSAGQDRGRGRDGAAAAEGTGHCGQQGCGSGVGGHGRGVAAMSAGERSG